MNVSRTRRIYFNSDWYAKWRSAVYRFVMRSNFRVDWDSLHLTFICMYAISPFEQDVGLGLNWVCMKKNSELLPCKLRAISTHENCIYPAIKLHFKITIYLFTIFNWFAWIRVEWTDMFSDSSDTLFDSISISSSCISWSSVISLSFAVSLLWRFQSAYCLLVHENRFVFIEWTQLRHDRHKHDGKLNVWLL